MIKDSIKDFENKLENIDMVKKLRKYDENLFSYVVEMCIIAQQECDTINNFFDEFTDHSSTHSLEVLKNGDSFSKNLNLNKIEIALFILSCYFHDIGMNVKTEQISKYTERKDFALEKEYLIDKIAIRNKIEENKLSQNVIDKFIMLEYVRERHHILSKEWILLNFPDTEMKSYVEVDNTKQYLWKHVAYICESHCLWLEQIVDGNFGIKAIARMDVDLTFISCLLRISDYCHIGKDRALPYVRICKDFYSTFSQKIWEALSCVNDMRFDLDNHRIVISADCDDARIHNALIKEADNIDKELHAQVKHLTKQNSKYRHQYFFVDSSLIKEADTAQYVYSPFGFRMNYSKITKLLIGSKLYDENLYALREVIQNSVDTLSVQRYKLPMIESYILINYKCDESNHEIEIFDNGTGMNKEICLENFLSIGSNSYWSTRACFNDFGNVKENVGLISSHGIGVLSYFLIANEIEIFTKYKECEAIHMQINGYDQNVVFMKTPESAFPKFNQELCKFATPWEQGHGTCVKMKLKRAFSVSDIIEFISYHIIRINHKLFFMIGSNNYEFVEIPHTVNPLREADYLRKADIENHVENFSYRNISNNDFSALNAKNFFESIQGTGLSFGELIKEIEDNNIFRTPNMSVPVFGSSDLQESPTLLSLVDFVKETYKEFKPDFYNGLWEKLINLDYDDEEVRGKLYLEIDGHKQIRNRVSQNGIWIKNGHVFIDNAITDIINTDNDIISYDIDITSKLFDLSASRDDIISCEYNYNLANSIAIKILTQIPKLIKKIEYVLAFPCGGKWYEGIRTLLYKIPESEWHFLYQKTLHKVYKEFGSQNEILEAIKSAKIYHVFQSDKNIAYSVMDIIQNPTNFKILMPIYVNSDSGLYGIDSYDSDYEKKKKVDLDALSEKRENTIIDCIEKSPYNVIFLPDYLQSFMTPLMHTFKWSVKEKDNDYVLFSITLSQDNCSQERNIDFIRKALKYKSPKR